MIDFAALIYYIKCHTKEARVLRDKPIRFNSRITIPNKLYLEEVKLLHKAEGISEIARKIFNNAEELFRHGIDISDIHTIKRIRDNL